MTYSPNPWIWRIQIEPAQIWDGDTLRCTIDRGFNDVSTRRAIRLAGIDTPELRGVERPDGLLARDAARQWVVDADVGAWPFLLETVKLSGKYGRIVGRVWRHVGGERDPVSLNAWLLATGHAEEYPKAEKI